MKNGVDKFSHTERGIRRTSCFLVPCGDGVPLEQPKTGYESQDRCGSGRLLSYQGCQEESELKIEHRTESD